MKQLLPVDEWVNVLPTVKFPDHAVKGRWRNENTTLSCDVSDRARFLVPVAVDRCYEITVKFSRTKGIGDFAILFPVLSQRSSIILDAFGGTLSGFGIVDSKKLNARVGTSSAKAFSAAKADGEAHDVLLRVKQSSGPIEISVDFDGEKLLDWQGDVSSLNVLPSSSLPNHSLLGIESHESAVNVHEMRVRVLKGGVGYELLED